MSCTQPAPIRMAGLTIFDFCRNAHADEAPVPCSLVLVPVGMHQGLAYPGGYLH